MDSYSSTSNSNTDSSSPNSFSTWFAYHYKKQQEFKTTKLRRPAFRSTLHSVRKSPAKNVSNKKPIAPQPPTPPKVYRVEPIEFKDVVQKLTGAVKFQLQKRRLREVAPPPLSLSPPHRQPYQMKPVVATESFNEEEEEEEKRVKSSFDCSFGALSPLGFSLSPSSVAWCSAMLLSTGTLASFEPNVL